MNIQQLPYFKIGDTFDLPIQLCDASTGEGIEITSGMLFTSSVNDQYNRKLADLEVSPYPDQVQSAGYVLLSCPDTSDWPAGLGQMDIKLVQGGAIRHSQTIEFTIVRSITT